jgi:Na+-transporting NADH:ubiquinone oxidoreductase subunit C
MVIAVAAVLSAAAMFLQPFQERNAKIEKIQDVLTSAGIESTRDNAEKLFAKHITAEQLVDRHGRIINDGRNPFDIDLKSELRKLKDLEAGKSMVEPAFPLFVCENKGKKIIIIPMLGKGLGGPIWGYVALKDDYNTIVGTAFDHKGETPGLGEKIATPMFEKRFIGKKIFDSKDNFVSIAVVKGGVAKSHVKPEHGIDALSGCTFTCNGVAEMLESCFANYVKYFKNQRSEIIRQEKEKRVQDSIAWAKAQEVPKPRIKRPDPVVETAPVAPTENSEPVVVRETE